METTKDKILSATIGFLKDNSNYEQLTLSKIAQSANIGKSTVYDYFKSKEELVEETSLFLINQYDNIIFEEFNKEDFNTIFTKQMKRLVMVVKDARMISNAIFNYHKESLSSFHSEKIQKTIYQVQLKLSKRFKEIFDIAKRENIISSKSNNEYKQNVIFALISGLLYQYVDDILVIEEDQLIELVKKNCIIILNS